MFGLNLGRGNITHLDPSEFASKPDKPIQQAGDQQQQEQQQNPGAGDQQENEEEVNPFDALFSEEEETDEERQLREAQEAGLVGPDGKPLTPQQITESKTKTLAEQIQQIIGGVKIGTDDIGEEFDPSDPKKFGEFMTKQLQRASTASLQASVMLVQQTMADFETRIGKRIDDTLRNVNSRSSAMQILQREIPEVLDKQHANFINMAFKQAMTKTKQNPTEAVKLVRSVVDSMGISKKANQQANPTSGGSRSGPDMLKSYFGQ